MKTIRTLFVVSSLAVAGSASAFGIGVKAGTTGVGADVGIGLVPTLSARIGYSYLSFNTTIDDTDIRYDATPKLSNANLFLDWSLIGPFRVTGGFIFNDNKINVTGTPSGGTYTINGTVYQASQVGSLSGTIKSGNRAAPYLGIGYGNVAGAGVNFYFDLGVMFQGSPKASLSATCGPSLPADQCAALQSNVVAEQADLQNSVNRFKYYPVASIGVTIGF